MKTIQVSIRESMYKTLEKRIKLGLYSNENEVVNKALEKLFSEQSRELLRNLTKKLNISEKEMLSELGRLRAS